MIATPPKILKTFEAVRIPAKPPVAQWVGRHLRFDPAGDVMASYVHAKSPYNRVIFGWWSDPEIEEIFMLYPTQSGKTTAMSACLAYSMRHDPGPVMFVQSTEETTKGFIEKRLRKMIRHTFPEYNNSEWTDERGAQLGNTDFYPAWSTSEDRLRSFPRRYIFGDETSIWKNPRKLVWERTKQYQSNRKGLWGTTPTVPSEQSWVSATEEYRLHRWEVPCPHCGEFQVLEFRQLKFDHCRRESGAWDLEQVEREAYYPCEHCGAVITQAQRPAMLQKGRAKSDCLERPKRKMSLRITCMDVPNVSWGLSARTWLECQANPEELQVFVTSWLVEPWEPRGESLNAEGIMKRTMILEVGAVPANTQCIFAAVDVQRDHVWVIVRAFMEDERSILIQCQRVDGRTPEGVAKVSYALDQCWEKVLSRGWKIGESAHSIGVMKTIVDSGDGVTAPDVYRWTDKHRGKIYLTKGSDSQSHPWRPSTVDKMPDGKPIIGGLPLYTVRTDFYRELVIGAFSADTKDAGAWMISAGTPDEYGKQMTSWQIVQRRHGKNNRIVREWKQIRRDDHYLDAECYCAALWEILRFVPKGKSKVQYGVIGRVGA